MIPSLDILNVVALVVAGTFSPMSVVRLPVTGPVQTPANGAKGDCLIFGGDFFSARSVLSDLDFDLATASGFGAGVGVSSEIGAGRRCAITNSRDKVKRKRAMVM